MSPAAIQYALEDARADILTMARLLCEAGYPRRGTAEEGQTIYDFAQKVQSLIPHVEAVSMGEPGEDGPSDGERLDWLDNWGYEYDGLLERGWGIGLPDGQKGNTRNLRKAIDAAMLSVANNRNLPRDRVGSRELVSLLSEWERVAFGHESGFLERFCHNAWQLAKVSWSSETMHVVYIAECGQHITDSIPLNEWLEFYEANAQGDSQSPAKNL